MGVGLFCEWLIWQLVSDYLTTDWKSGEVSRLAN
jgi:hypothetical protein